MIRESLPVKALLRGSHLLGVPRLTATLAGRRLRILMYHGVTARPAVRAGGAPGAHPVAGSVVNHYGYNLPLPTFAAQIDYLVARCHPVSLDDVLAGRLSSRRTNVLLTFDDGYENNFVNAFPLLRERGVPALFALPTAFVDERRPLWNDVLEAAVEWTERDRVELELGAERAAFDLRRPGARAALFERLMRHAVEVPPHRRDDAVAAATRALEVEVDAERLFREPDYRPLSTDQVRSMAASGLTEFASHSVSHFLMARLDGPERVRELEASKSAVEELAGAPCRAFCVPGGSYDRALVELAHSLGYEAVLTSDDGWADPAAGTWNRCGVFADFDAYRFADLVHGPVVDSLTRLRRAVRGA